jgi:hypothetical protein
MAKKHSTHPEKPEEVKEELGTSRNRRSTPSVTSSLFQSDPEENVKLWMEKFFPGIVLSREEAIRQWLARPPEFRVESFPEVSTNNDRTSTPDTPEEVTATVEDEVPLAQSSVDNSNHHVEQAPHSEQAPPTIPIGAGLQTLQTDRPRKLPRLLFRLAAFSVLAFVIIKLLWAIPMTRVFPHADAAIPAPKSHNAETVAASTVPVSKSVAENAQQSAPAAKPDTDSAKPSRIESVSIGCKDTQPCIVISMLGKENVPKLSALTNPDRLVIDFQGSEYSAGAVHHIAVGRGAVKAVRIGGSTGDHALNTRVVIDLVAQCDYELNTLTNKFIVNMYPKGTTRQPE